MGDVTDRLSPELQRFLESQAVFFVATAPAGARGHVNLSPKGLDSLRVLSDRKLGYLDLTGSGNETSAHLLENGRMTLMVCAFEGPPRILRVYGQGSVHLPGSERWDELRPRFPDLEGTRQIVTLAIERVATSCGYGVPKMRLEGPRDTLRTWSRSKGVEGLREYRRRANRASVDGLPTHLGQTEGEPRSVA
jgi:hypothetical protein